MAVGSDMAQGEGNFRDANLANELREPVLFDAALEPHRALPRSGLIVVMLAAGIITLGVGGNTPS
ncbi:MAG: hypothetical protein HOM52_08800 [Rhodospirillaceae bacterium]|nr:hypothetical protein [Rhodospirillaceae bacterium]MBT7291364.1 hypothetical protein [Rhodospirillaceae bacterium]